MRPLSPAAWMILASACFALMGVFVKEGAALLSIPALVLWRSAISLVLAGAVLYARGDTPRTRHVDLHFYRGAIGIAALYMFYVAVASLPLSTAVTLNYLSPVFLTLLTATLLRERLHLPHVAAVVLSFFGTVLLLRPTFGSEHWVGGLVAVGSALTSAVAYRNVRVLVQAGESEDRVVFWFSASGVVAMLPLVFTGNDDPFVAEALWPVLAMGVTGTLGQLAMTRAFGRGLTVPVAALSYGTVVFSSILGVALYGEVLTPAGWLAIGIVIAGGVLALRAGPARGAGADE